RRRHRTTLISNTRYPAIAHNLTLHFASVSVQLLRVATVRRRTNQFADMCGSRFHHRAPPLAATNTVFARWYSHSLSSRKRTRHAQGAQRRLRVSSHFRQAIPPAPNKKGGVTALSVVPTVRRPTTR